MVAYIKLPIINYNAFIFVNKVSVIKFDSL